MTNSMPALVPRYAKALLQAGRRAHLLDDLQTAAHTDHFHISGDRFHAGDERPKIAIIVEREAQIVALLSKLPPAEFLADRLNFEHAGSAAAVVAELHPGNKLIGLGKSKQRDTGGVRAAAGEGVQHPQQDFAERLLVGAGFVEVTYDAAHRFSNTCSILQVSCKRQEFLGYGCPVT